MSALTDPHDFEACPGDFSLLGDQGHELLGTLHEGLPVVAVRTPTCERNGTPHTWVLTCDVARGNRPHAFDWTYLR